MATSSELPHFVRGVSAAGLAALRGVGKKLAPWQLAPGVSLDVSLDDAGALAADLLSKLKFPEHVFSALPRAAQDQVASSLGLPARKAWKPAAPVPKDMPSYQRPSWEKDVYAVLFARQPVAPPTPRAPAPQRRSHAAAWPELSSLARWKKTPSRARLGALLATRLGEGWEALAPAGPHQLPRVRSAKLGLSFVAVPGGAFLMGLSPEEQKALSRAVRSLGPEASAHARELAKLARPVRRVKVEPFLCAEGPLLASHASALGCQGDATNAHRVLRLTSEATAGLVERTGLRLLAEAEWEWLARAGGARAWLSGDEPPADWAQARLAGSIEAEAHPLGVLGWGWGEWVDDGWHASYRGAPAKAQAWEPKSRPELVRGGALDLWPWQVGGELVLCLAASRDKAGERASHAVRLAGLLPARR